MTRQDFIAKYRPRLLLIATDAWAIRRESPSAVGLALDQHMVQLKSLMNEMYDDLQPTILPANGHLNGHTPRKTTP